MYLYVHDLCNVKVGDELVPYHLLSQVIKLSFRHHRKNQRKYRHIETGLCVSIAVIL